MASEANVTVQATLGDSAQSEMLAEVRQLLEGHVGKGIPNNEIQQLINRFIDMQETMRHS